MDYAMAKFGHGPVKPLTKAMLKNSDIIRFNERFVVGFENACWPWNSLVNINGRGIFSVWREGRQFTYSAPKVSFVIYKSDDPMGLFACHTCDNPICINPNHIFLGSVGENSADMVRKKRHKFGETSPLSKIKEQDVRDARRWYSVGYGTTEIGAHLGLTRGYLQRLIQGHFWKHVDNPVPLRKNKAQRESRGLPPLSEWIANEGANGGAHI